ncbi:hypothetical protein GINT2_001324 [Glugoides intestinalis]
MKFSLYIFDSDYLKEKFIPLENCSLLSSNLPKKIPKIFFTRNLHKDFECEILVVEVLKKDFLTCERTQRLAKTVLITSTPFTSLDIYLSLGINCSLICMNRKTVLFSSGMQESKQKESDLQKFNRTFDVERSYDLRDYSNLLDIGILRQRSWLIGPIRNKSANRNCLEGNEDSVQEHLKSDNEICISQGNACTLLSRYFQARSSLNYVNSTNARHDVRKRASVKRRRKMSLDDSFVEEIEYIDMINLESVCVLLNDENLLRAHNSEKNSIKNRKKVGRRMKPFFDDSFDSRCD